MSNINHYKRKCPKCNKTIKYKTYKVFANARKLNSICWNCANKNRSLKLKNRVFTEEHIKNLKKSSKKGSNNPMFGKTGHLNPFFGKRHTTKSKNKMRLGHINHYNRLGIRECCNPIACKFMDKYGKQNGYNFQHGLNGGEFYIKNLGYFVDGYDKEKNIIFEYDEPYHNKPKNIIKDLIRMKKILFELNCIFIRYNERNKTIKKCFLSDGLYKETILQ